MVTRRVRGKNISAALRAARKKYPNRTVTKVNWLKDSRPNDKGKLYQVVSHKPKKRGRKSK